MHLKVMNKQKKIKKELRAISNLLKALVLMFKAHLGQRDKSGKPYILHPLTVCKNVKGYDEKIVALLHDVFEDTDIYIDSVLFLTKTQREALKLLTKTDDNYLEYIRAICPNTIARNVKMADLKHNMDLKRIKNPTLNDYRRHDRYLIYYKMLKMYDLKVNNCRW